MFGMQCAGEVAIEGIAGGRGGARVGLDGVIRVSVGAQVDDLGDDVGDRGWVDSDIAAPCLPVGVRARCCWLRRR